MLEDTQRWTLGSQNEVVGASEAAVSSPALSPTSLTLPALPSPRTPVNVDASPTHSLKEASPPAASYGAPMTNSFEILKQARSFSVDGDGIETPARKSGALETARFVVTATAKFPVCCVLLWFMFFGGLLALSLVQRPLSFESDFSVLLKTDINTSLARDAFEAAVHFRNSFEVEPRYGQDPACAPFELTVLYHLQADQFGRGLFEPSVLRQISAFENRLRALPGWHHLCSRTEEAGRELCELGASFVGYALPTLKVHAGELAPESFTPDGGARDPLPLETVLHLLEMRGLTDVVLPLDFDPIADREGPATLRSHFRFQHPCNYSRSQRLQSRAQLQAEWEQFAFTSLFPHLRSGLSDENGGRLRVFFTGTGFEELEILRMLVRNLGLMVGCLPVLLLCLTLYTRHVFATVGGFLLVLLPFPLGYAIFSLLVGSTALSIPFLLSLFLTMCFSMDITFLYTDAWRNSAQQQFSDEERIMRTYTSAGVTTLASTVTAAVVFLANLMSTLRLLRETGVLMCLCVACAWVVITTGYVPICLVEDRYGPALYKVCGSCCRKHLGGSRKIERRSARILSRCFMNRHRWRFSFCLVPSMLAVSFGYMAVWQWRSESAIANLFHEDHNLNAGRHAMERFVPLRGVFSTPVAPPRRVEPICSLAATFDAGAYDSCVFSWCEAQPQYTSHRCTCYRRQNPLPCGNAPFAMVVERFVGFHSLAWQQFKPFFTSHLMPLNHNISTVDVMKFEQDLSPVLLRDWATNEAEFKPMAEATVSVGRSNLASSTCGWDDLCFCGGYVCKPPAPWQELQHAIPHPPVPGRTFGAEVARRILSHRPTVEVSFGLRLDLSAPFIGRKQNSNPWTFSEGFDITQPTVQREIFNFCSRVPQQLHVIERFCWIEDFRNFVLERGEMFPLPAWRFGILMQNFMQEQAASENPASDFLWVDGTGMRACFASFVVDTSMMVDSNALLYYLDLWGDYVGAFNHKSSMQSGEASHSSTLWLEADTHSRFKRSAVYTICILVTITFLCMCVSMKSFELALYALLTQLAVLSSLAFFMVVVCRWPIGQIEIFAFLVSISCALDNAVHLLQMYGKNQALYYPLPHMKVALEPSLSVRLQRVTFAVKAVGPAIVASAITRAGCALFISVCSLRLFQEVAFATTIVSVLSVFAVLVPLPAALLMVGPLELRKSRMPIAAILTFCRRMIFYRQRRKQQERKAQEELDKIKTSANVVEGSPKGSPKGSGKCTPTSDLLRPPPLELGRTTIVSEGGLPFPVAIGRTIIGEPAVFGAKDLESDAGSKGYGGEESSVGGFGADRSEDSDLFMIQGNHCKM